ncbi:50S ribosome-binding GTPase [Candidatus Woesearchaeota archaeon]|nr:50S ribosome-binding GTPase [Candidatus Woesearchaeota archaeon]
MNFQSLLKVENSKFYVNVAFRSANERAKTSRQKIKKVESVVQKSKIVELTKLEGVRDVLIKNLGKIVDNFPRVNELNEFYRELLKCYVDVGQLRKSLGAIGWATNKVDFFYKEYRNKIKRAQGSKFLNKYRREFYGRVSSAVRQIDKNLMFIEEARKIMKNFPSIKENILTVAITGFPNVGKSTLLNKLTGARAKVAPYSFTTKSLNLGYILKDGKRFAQIIDSPGTLNRFDKMNNIEKQSDLAMKYCASLIIFVFDPTKQYPIKDQIELYEKTKKLGKKIIVYVSKTDIAEIPEEIKKFKGIDSYEELKKEIMASAQ